MINTKGWRFIGVILLLSIGSSYSLAAEKEKEEEVHGVAVVSLDAPMRATIGRNVNIEVVIGNETPTKLTTVLTVTCLTTEQQIGMEAKALDGLASHKIVYSWNTERLKEGTYVIRAELEPVPGETDIDDNVKQVEVFLER
ncbi:MAG TPA: hypothetical protein ACFYD6_06505 [Candidatus Brocadiia bacterium]|nr:hypothetical protein [Candidatus Brocadiales bacterium]